MMDKDKQGRPAEYLGDGAYVRYEHGAYVIYTSNGLTELSTIKLDGDAVDALIRFKKDIDNVTQ